MQELSRQFPHWQSARALLPGRSNIHRVETRYGTMWHIVNIPLPDLDDTPATDAQPQDIAAEPIDAPREDSPNPN